MNELRAVWKNVFFCKRVLACLISREWSSADAFKNDYRLFERAGDDDMINDLLNPNQRTTGSKPD